MLRLKQMLPSGLYCVEAWVFTNAAIASFKQCSIRRHYCYNLVIVLHLEGLQHWGNFVSIMLQHKVSLSLQFIISLRCSLRVFTTAAILFLYCCSIRCHYCYSPLVISLHCSLRVFTTAAILSLK